MPTFRAKLEVKETRVKSGFHERLGAKNHWNFRFRVDPWNSKKFFSQVRTFRFQPAFASEPALNLLIAMDLAADTKNPDILDTLDLHGLTSAQIQAVEPELYFIATQSEVARNKLIQMKFPLPELSPSRLQELGHTNILSSASPAGK